MEIDHPGAAPLTQEEQVLLERFRQRLHERAATAGLSSEEIRRIVEAMREHPHASTEAVRILMQEARGLLSGQSLVSFDWE